MRETQLVFVDGLPGLGKTTTASWLASRLQSRQLATDLFLESQPGHPTN
jgi:shikimate kinase